MRDTIQAFTPPNETKSPNFFFYRQTEVHELTSDVEDIGIVDNLVVEGLQERGAVAHALERGQHQHLTDARTDQRRVRVVFVDRHQSDKRVHGVAVAEVLLKPAKKKNKMAR